MNTPWLASICVICKKKLINFKKIKKREKTTPTKNPNKSSNRHISCSRNETFYPSQHNLKLNPSGKKKNTNETVLQYVYQSE